MKGHSSSVLRAGGSRTVGHIVLVLLWPDLFLDVQCLQVLAARGFGHGSVAVTLLRKMQEIRPSAFPAHHQLSHGECSHASPNTHSSNLQRSRSRPRWAWTPHCFSAETCPKVTNKEQLLGQAREKFPLLKGVPTSRTQIRAVSVCHIILCSIWGFLKFLSFSWGLASNGRARAGWEVWGHSVSVITPELMAGVWSPLLLNVSLLGWAHWPQKCNFLCA